MSVANGFYFAACKNSQRIAKEETRRRAITETVRDICTKYNKSIDELTKAEVTKAEYKQIMTYMVLCNYPAHLYPNLFV